ncbi:MAG TPA: DEAD/DEAH box helicase [Sedimentisphaerales bacterium]|nr:DEAD/DEAH box helicase [Sedimentisphaerales bacterium]
MNKDIIFRPYQTEAFDGIRTQLAQNNSTLLVMATGLGKTVVFSQAVNHYLQFGRVMILAHREELVGQAARHLKRITGIEPDIEMSDYRVIEYGVFRSKIIVGTIQTQVSGMNGRCRMHKFNPDEFSLLIIDEAHHSAAKSYLRVIDYYCQNPNLKVLGVTATPDRADERRLGQIFESVAYEYGIREGIDDGWLVPISQRSVYVEGLDYSSIRTTAGDLNGGDLARVLEFEEMLHGIASPTIELCGDRKTLIFAASLVQADRLTEILNRHKPQSAEWVHGSTPKEERRKLFPRYAAGEFQYLVNVGVTTEGFDEPGIQVVVMARPTKSRSLYAQEAGRGTRTLPGIIDGLENSETRKEAIRLSGKPCLEIIDFVGNAGRHRLITSADILGGKYSDAIVERAKRNTEEKSVETSAPVDVFDELQLAEWEIEREKREAIEAAHRKHLKLQAKYSTAKVNPFDVYGIEPWRERAWHKDRQPTEKQIAMLEHSGVDVSGLSFTHAQQLIKRIIENQQQGCCSYKQSKILLRYGYNPAEISFEEASEIIGKIAANGWKQIA